MATSLTSSLLKFHFRLRDDNRGSVAELSKVCCNRAITDPALLSLLTDSVLPEGLQYRI